MTLATMHDAIQEIRAFSRFYARLFKGPEGLSLPGLSVTEGRILSEMARQEGLTARAIMKTLG